MTAKEIFTCNRPGFRSKMVLVVVGLLMPMAVSGAPIWIEDFETDLDEYPAVSNGWESKAGEHSTASISRVTEAMNGVGAGQIAFDVKPGSWALVQRKIEGTDGLNRGPTAISFWLKGSGSGKMTVELEESYTYKWRQEVPLDDTKWHQVTLNLSDFKCADKSSMSPADLVVVKFVGYGGAAKVLLDDIRFEFAE